MLEEKIDLLTDAILRLTKILEDAAESEQPAPQKPKPEPKKKAEPKKAEPKPEPKKAEPKKEDSDDVSFEDFRAKLMDLAQARDNSAPPKFLKAHGYSRASEVPSDDRGSLMVELDQMLSA